MRIRPSFAVVVFLAFLAGCAMPGSNSITYQPPSTPGFVQNEVVVSLPFDAAWSKLLENLSRSGFMVANLDKNSGFISVTYAASDGAPYVDCGVANVTSKRGSRVNTFSFPVAKANSYDVDEPGGGGPLEVYSKVTRDVRVEGRINIMLIPDQGNTVKFSVNGKYVFTESGSKNSYLKHVMHEEAMSKGTDTKPLPAFSVDFSTNRAGTRAAEKTLTCISTGELEKSILSMLPH